MELTFRTCACLAQAIHGGRADAQPGSLLTLLPKFGVDAKILTSAIDSGKSYLGVSGAPLYTGALPGLFS
jgi:hypothetical protein